MAAPRSAVEAWLSEQVDLLDDSLGPVESVRASYSLSCFDYDPIDMLQGIPVRTPTGVSFWRLQDLSALLHAGSRLGFRVSNYGAPQLEQHGEQHTINGFEPPRVSERLHFLRGWSPWEDRGSTHRRCGSGRPVGVRSRASARLAVGGDPVGRHEDRVYGGDTPPLGAPGRA